MPTWIAGIGAWARASVCEHACRRGQASEGRRWAPNVHVARRGMKWRRKRRKALSGDAWPSDALLSLCWPQMEHGDALIGRRVDGQRCLFFEECGGSSMLRSAPTDGGLMTRTPDTQRHSDGCPVSADPSTASARWSRS